MQCAEKSVWVQFFSSKNDSKTPIKRIQKAFSTVNLNKFHEHRILHENIWGWDERKEKKFKITLTYFLDTFFQEINFRFSSLTNHRQRGFFKRRKRRQKKKNFLRFSLSLTHAVCHSCVYGECFWISIILIFLSFALIEKRFFTSFCQSATMNGIAYAHNDNKRKHFLFMNEKWKSFSFSVFPKKQKYNSIS